MQLSDFLTPAVIKLIIQALGNAYEGNRTNFDPTIGNTPTSYGVSVWQSSMHFLEQSFGEVIDADVYRSGSIFHVKLPTCRLSFYKFGSSTDDVAANFRLDGSRSRERQLIVENNQLSLFSYTMSKSAQPVSVPEIVIVHSGNAFQGLLEVHIGAPISSERATDGWLLIERVYEKESDADDAFGYDVQRYGERFDQMPQPEVDVELLPDEDADHRRFDEMTVPDVKVELHLDVDANQDLSNVDET